MDLKIALEYREVALRPQHLAASYLNRTEVLELIDAIALFGEPVKVWMRARPLSSDPNDDMVLQLAISGSAEALVTHNEEWVLNRRKPTKELAERALHLLEKAGNNPPEPGDELPEGYQPIRRKREATA